MGIHTVGKREWWGDIDVFEYAECRRYGYIVLHAIAPISDEVGFEEHVLFGLYRVLEISGVIETYFFIPLFFPYPVFAFEGVDTTHVDGEVRERYVQGGVGISLRYIGGKSYAEWRIWYVVWKADGRTGRIGREGGRVAVIG